MIYTCRSVITLGDTCPFLGSSFLNTCSCGWGYCDTLTQWLSQLTSHNTMAHNHPHL